MLRFFSRLISAPVLLLAAMGALAQSSVLPSNLNVVDEQQGNALSDVARSGVNIPAHFKRAFEQRHDKKRQDALQTAKRAQERHTESLMEIPGIIGTGLSWNSKDQAVVKVFLDETGSVSSIPERIDGIPIEAEYIGTVYALNVSCETRDNCDDTATAAASSEPWNQRDWHPRPVPIGVSTGHVNVSAGTLGCRLSAGCHTYALSNAHVYAEENSGLVGDSIVQPGTFDGGTDPDDRIGTLFASVPIVFGTGNGVRNKVDAAIAETSASEVGTATRSNGYGEPRTTIQNATVGMQVMKYGRSSAITYGYVQTINSTVNVAYDAGTARFINQIIIRSNDESDFSRVGDSGSLIVRHDENGGSEGAHNRKPVGLLYASGTDITVANHMSDVISELNAVIGDSLEVDGEL